MQKFRTVVVPMICLILLAGGCRAAYYSTMEKFGVEKRHLLKDNVQKAQKEQQQASEQFKDVLTRIKISIAFKIPLAATATGKSQSASLNELSLAG
ncbi:MAG: DUF2959 family protein [Desulfosarcina sp.]